MEKKRDLAIILRTIPYEDRHRIVTALTEQHGQITAMAKNAVQSRRFGGCLQPFAASEWRFTERPGSEMVHLEEASIRRSFEGLRAQFERLSLAGVFTELMLKLAPQNQPCPELFRLHSNGLAAVEELPGNGIDLGLLTGFMAKLLQWSGSQPQMDHCLGCRKPVELLESESALSCVVADAGWVCPECRAQHTHHIRRDQQQQQQLSQSLIRVTPAALRDFQMSLHVPIRQIPQELLASQQEHRELFRFLEALFVYHLPGLDRKPLNSLRFLDLESGFQLSAAQP